jgi:murein DD-endopeptidase MepM/ murein hydrolase activator NlpD
MKKWKMVIAAPPLLLLGLLMAGGGSDAHSQPRTSSSWMVPVSIPWGYTTRFGVIDALHPGGHGGEDLAGAGMCRSLIVAAGAGRVTHASTDYQPGAGLGLWVSVEHDLPVGCVSGKCVTTTYAHLQQVLVSEGERVVAGDPIGLAGTTGYSTGVHLHLEVRDPARISLCPHDSSDRVSADCFLTSLGIDMASRPVGVSNRPASTPASGECSGGIS